MRKKKIAKIVSDAAIDAAIFRAVGRIIYEIITHPKAFQAIVDATNKAVADELKPLLPEKDPDDE